MIRPLIKVVEDQVRREKLPEFKIGDTVTVHVRIVEGDKHRIQPYTGVVMARRGQGTGEMFTVRRIVNNEGVERIFPLHSPKIAKIEVDRPGHVRRAKLYYLRKRVGKARRVKDAKRGSGSKEQVAAVAGAE
jgi:large subunit ribosomal protein L19